VTHIANILRHDPRLKAIVYNEFTGMLDVTGDLPWRQVKPGWGDADIACAKVYFEQVYGIWSPAKFKDALLAVVSAERAYHPIKEYLEPLTWDGVERIDTLLIDYLGAEDNQYTRSVSRKTLCAAVARVYEPGVKFDSILVLNGPQGIGKSTFFSRLGGKWYSDSLSISDMKDKTAAEKLQGYWVLELGELAGIKKVDVETVKSFITRTDDKFRQSYGIAVESHPRACVIVGSTNSESGFLRDITGNRRFWPVLVQGETKHTVFELTLAIVDQLWAEAIEKYRAGEELFLKGEVAAQAYCAQQAAMEADDREGIIADYLEKLLPETWDDMDLYQRRCFLSGDEFGGEKQTGSVRRERVCTMEVWCECFGKERQNLKRTDSYEIEGILNRIGSWVRYTGNASGKMRISGYGIQKTFVRAKKETVGNA
jgi:predicted P-loop ATPase